MNPRSVEGDTRLPRFSLDRRITVLVLALTAIVVGAVAVASIPLEMFPRGWEGHGLSVRVPWQDAPAQQVRERIVEPLEEELSTVKGLDQTFSVAFEGFGRVFMRFKTGTDMDVAYREARDRAERIRREFPPDADRYYIRKDDPSGFPVHIMGVAVDEEVVNMYDLVQQEIVLPLERLDGVATVTVEGLEEKEILIELDRERTEGAGLNIYQLAMELAGDNFTMASGHVLDGSRKLLLRSVARYDDLEALRSRRVGPSVRLGDVARISYEEPEKPYRVRAMSKPALAINVVKEGEANTQEVCNRVEALMDELREAPQLVGVEIITIFSQGQVIEQQLATLASNGLFGGFMAGFVLFFFLRRNRLTLIITLAIPLSLLIGLTVMYFAGETLNLLTLVGLMICVGLLVDNSVVVAENIHRFHRDGLGRRESCLRGAGEISLAIIMSTLTTMVVFMPAVLLEGDARFFLTRLALPIAVSLAASLGVALVLIPLSVYVTLPVNGKGKDRFVHRTALRIRELLRRIYEATFGRIGRAYSRLLAVFMIHRVELVVGVIVVFVAAVVIPFSTEAVEIVDEQEDEERGFRIEVAMPEGTTLEESEAWFLEAEKLVEENAEELDLGMWLVVCFRGGGRVEGWFNYPRTDTITGREVTERMRDMLPVHPGMEVFTGLERESDEVDEEDTYQVTLNGDDVEILEAVARELEDVLERVPGVLGRLRRMETGPGELGIVLDRAKAQAYGVNPQVAAGVVGYALRGTALPRFIAEGREIPVRIRFQEEDREGLDKLASFWVPTASGGVQPLSSFTRVERLDAPELIFAINKRVTRTITLELEEGDEEETIERLAALTAAIDLPEGVSFGGPPATFDDDLSQVWFGLGVSALFIYLLMGLLFESFILPLSILFTIPLSFIGVIGGHAVAGKDVDFLGFVAAFLLIGVVVNNGIVLVDYINRLRRAGSERREAILEAANRRFRPIMMTALTTVCAMVPLAFAGRTPMGLSYTSFSWTLIGGMTTATLLTLLVVPVFYTLFDDARVTLLGALSSVFRSLGRSTRSRQDASSAAVEAGPAPSP